MATTSFCYRTKKFKVFQTDHAGCIFTQISKQFYEGVGEYYCVVRNLDQIESFLGFYNLPMCSVVHLPHDHPVVREKVIVNDCAVLIG